MRGTIYEFEQGPRVAYAPAISRPAFRPVPRNRAAPLIGIIRNPRSHRNKGKPAEFAGRPDILTRTPRTRADLREELAEFARRGIDYLVVDGGDGTVRDVLTCGEPVFADRWPKMVVLPKGKTNALAVDLGLPNVWSLADALEAIAGGQTIERRPLAVELPAGCGDNAERGLVQGFILGAGAFTKCTQAAQQAHRRGAFNSFAVLLTIVWTLWQTLFGRITNPMRAGIPMQIALGRGELPLGDSGRGQRGRRFIVFASTLEQFPLGAKPFGRLRRGLKLTVLDAPLRRLVALAPFVLAGFDPSGLQRLGLHRVVSDQVVLDLGDRFILDGEYFPAGRYVLRQGSPLRFVTP